MAPNSHRYFMFAAAFGPPVGVAVAILLLWNQVVGWVELSLFLSLYAITAMGISVGFHRLLTHRSFTTGKRVRFLLALAGSVAAQGPAITWAAHHRRHHQLADQEGDPHSPNMHGDGFVGMLKGFGHAHIVGVQVGSV